MSLDESLRERIAEALQARRPDLELDFAEWEGLADAVLAVCREGGQEQQDTDDALAEARGLLIEIPWKPEYAGEATAGIYRALQAIEDGMKLPDAERETALRGPEGACPPEADKQEPVPRVARGFTEADGALSRGHAVMLLRWLESGREAAARVWLEAFLRGPEGEAAEADYSLLNEPEKAIFPLRPGGGDTDEAQEDDWFDYDLVIRQISGSLKSTIAAHGPVTSEWVGSAAKRATRQIQAWLEDPSAQGGQDG